MKTIIGIDPGAHGGIAVLYSDNNIYIYDMPSTPKDILEFFDEFRGKDCYAILEDVGHGMPGQSSSATAKFARHNGHLEMALLACGIPTRKVIPSKWMRSLGIGSSSGLSKKDWKNKLKAKAQELFPCTKMTLATCDAALIAYYGKTNDR